MNLRVPLGYAAPRFEPDTKNRNPGDYVYEKRRSTRFRIPAPAIMTIGKREIRAFTREISTSAAYFRTAEEDKPLIGQRLDFLIDIPPSLSYSSPCFITGWGRIHRIDDLVGNETGVVVEIFDYEIKGEAARDDTSARPQEAGN